MPMAITLVAQTAAASTNTTNVTTAAITTTGATLLIVVVGQYETSPVGTVTDSKGNTWTALTSQGLSGNVREKVFYTVPTTVGTGHTVTYTGTGADYPALCVAAFAGVLGTSPLDQTAGAVGTSSVSAGSVTPTQVNELVISGLGYNQTTTVAISGGFTLGAHAPYQSGANFGAALAHLIQTTAVVANPTWSLPSSDGAAATNATFKAAAVGAFLAGTATGAVTLAGPLTTTSARPRWDEVGTQWDALGIRWDPAPPAILLAGTALGVGTLVGALTTGIRLAAAVPAVATSIGTLTIGVRLAATPSTTTTVVGSLTTVIRLAAAPTGIATSTGTLTTAVRFAAGLSGTATVAGALSVIPAGLAGDGLGRATLAGTVTTVIRFQGALAGTAVGIGSLSMGAPSAALAGTVSAIETATGQLTTAVQLVGGLAGTATVSGALLVGPPPALLPGALLGSGQLTGSLVAYARLIGVALGRATVTGALTAGLGDLGPTLPTQTERETRPRTTTPVRFPLYTERVPVARSVEAPGARTTARRSPQRTVEVGHG